MFIDSHCHLNHEKFQGDVAEVVERARRNGVGVMVTINTCLEQFDEVLAIARRFPDIYGTVGVHPHDAEKEPDVSVAQLLERASDPLIIGIGETGLDYFYEHSPRDIQQASFRRHIEASRKSQLPLIVHTRDAEADTLAILREEMGKGAYPGVIHCFSASRDFAEQALDMGFYISISGIVTFKTAEDLRATVRMVPLDRLLIETDAPYLAPIPFRGKRNEPALISHTAARLAELKGVSVSELANATTENFRRLFSKAVFNRAGSAS